MSRPSNAATSAVSLALQLAKHGCVALSTADWAKQPPRLTLRVLAKERVENHNCYSLECFFMGNAENAMPLAWTVSKRLSQLREELHDAVKSELGSKYVDLFRGCPFSNRLGAKGTSETLNIWCAKLASCISSGVVPPAITVITLKALCAPDAHHQSRDKDNVGSGQQSSGYADHPGNGVIPVDGGLGMDSNGVDTSAVGSSDAHDCMVRVSEASGLDATGDDVTELELSPKKEGHSSSTDAVDQAPAQQAAEEPQQTQQPLAAVTEDDDEDAGLQSSDDGVLEEPGTDSESSAEDDDADSSQAGIEARQRRKQKSSLEELAAEWAAKGVSPGSSRYFIRGGHVLDMTQEFDGNAT